MCMFSYRNSSNMRALSKGIERFECGACPECLQKKSRTWALRCSMQAKQTPGVMVTLTYDSYKLGSSIEENPVDSTLHVNKKHCQNFIKRLRKHFPGREIKYLLTAEYGKRTHRAHYHALLFGVEFDDLIQYKKSKRNNIIYKSQTLEKIWSHGICTVDCVNLSAKVARYCTKYCAKDYGVDDTFMLFSRGIGEQKLLEKFNGLSYWIDGREYSIPRQIWQKFIEKKYNILGYSKYVGIRHLEIAEKIIYNKLKKSKSLAQSLNIWRVELSKLENSALSYHRQAIKREIYQTLRDSDFLYKRYLRYWKNKNAICDLTRPNDYRRILDLPDKKYWSYKQKALKAKALQSQSKDFKPPRSNCSGFMRFKDKKVYDEKSFAPLTRHYTANDTERAEFAPYIKELNRLRTCFTFMNAQKAEITPFGLFF